MGVVKYIWNSTAMNLQPGQDYQAHPTTVSERAETVQGSDSRHLNTVFLTIGVVTILILSLLLVLLVMWIIVRRRNSKKRLITTKYDTFFTTMGKTTPFSIIRMTKQLSEPCRQSNNTCSTVNFVTEKPQLVHTELLKRDTETGCTYNTDKMTKYHSFDRNSEANKPNSNGFQRLKSLAAFLEPETNVSITYTLKYVKNMSQLQLKLQGLSDLPKKCFGYNIYAIVYLFPHHSEGIRSHGVSGSKETELQETFVFDGMTLPEVDKATIRLVLQYKRTLKSRKERFLGEVYFKCCDVDWIGDQPVAFESALHKRRDTNGTAKKYISKDLGSLFVCLEYQSVAQKMKVMIRKAANLPKSDKRIGRPGHYVVITLLKSENAIKTLETRVRAGYNPVWYQPFLFDVNGNDINDYSLEFVIMHRKIHTKDAVVGHVTIGQNGCKSGKFHWKDIISPMPVEMAMWHCIIPMLTSSQAHNEE